MNNSIFRKNSFEKISSPDKLDSYLKTSHISMWILLMALMIILVGVIVWCLFGSVATTVSYYGIISDDCAFCFVPPDEVYNLELGMSVNLLPQGIDNDKLGIVTGKIKEISGKPVEASKELVKYDALWLSDKISGKWIRTVTIGLDANQLGFTAELNHLCLANIIINEVRPIDIIFGY